MNGMKDNHVEIKGSELRVGDVFCNKMVMAIRPITRDLMKQETSRALVTLEDQSTIEITTDTQLLIVRDQIE
jgi:hypothetical protein